MKTSGRARIDRLHFVLHLGDFIYEIVWYPEERPQGYYDCRLHDIVRYPDGEKISDFHVPTTLADYRAVYRAYLHDPDLQDARARWPFICMWDNHEYSWQGYQGIQVFGSDVRAGADTQGRREPGMVGIPAGARKEAKRSVARDVRSPACDRHADHQLR